MMRKIHLHGPLKDKCGETFEFDVNNIAQMQSMLNNFVPGYRQALGEMQNVRILRSKGEEDLYGYNMENINNSFMDATDIHVCPEYDGSIFVPAMFVAIGMTATAAAVTAAVLNIAMAIALGAIMQALAPTPKQANTAQSSIFNAPENTATQGVAKPLIYGGPVMVGSILINSGVFNDHIDMNATFAPNPVNPDNPTSNG